jgi:hypothetical protein
VTGRWEQDKPNPLEGMSEEQKEFEAMELVNMMDKLCKYVPVLHLIHSLPLSTFWILAMSSAELDNM